MKDSEIEWFRPLWLRVLITAAITVWFGYEVLFSHDTLWMVITGAALAYAVWNLFIRFDARAAEMKKPADGNGDGKPEA
jgi:purine-cytosine permease-like protein